jgi:hypothetical protein
MKARNIIILVPLLIFTGIVNAQEDRPKIKDFVGQEIIVEDSFAGQSFTLKKEKNEYYVERNIFGSGRPVVATMKYDVLFNSKYQIEFPPIEENESIGTEQISCERYILSVENEGLCLFLNGFKLTIKKIKNDT